MKRKIVSILLALLTVISMLNSCTEKGNDIIENTESTDETNEDTEQGELSGEPIVITLNPLCDNSDMSFFHVLTEKGKNVDLPSPTRESYIFKGWYKDPDLKEKFDMNEKVQENTVLFAKWDFYIPSMENLENPVTVQFITNGGKFSAYMNLGFVTIKGRNVKMKEPSKDNYAFLGWYTDFSCTEKYVEGPINEDLRLFAKWKPKYYEDGMTLPSLSIKTNDGIDITSRDSYKGCKITVFDGKEYDLQNVLATVKGRGNSTWTQFDKKSFKIKFNEKINLFGMGSAKDFLLIANSFDQSMMRNYTAYTFAGLFGNSFTTECRFVHLYVNDDYRGMYLVTEQTERGKHRVDIEDGSSLEQDTGYLAEYGGEVDVTGHKSFHIKPVTVGEETFMWKENRIGCIISPSGKICTDEQRDFFANYVNAVNEAIFKKDFESFESLCDVDSFVDYFILNEILYSGDFGYSFFMYKPAKGKLCMGPLWDYDQSAGNSMHGGIAYDKWETASKHLWFESLRQIPEFMELARNRYIEKYNIIHSITDIVKNKYNEIVTDLDLNYTRWDEIGVAHWRSIREQMEFTTQKQHVDFYVEWLTNRLCWLEAPEQFNITEEDIK